MQYAGALCRLSGYFVDRFRSRSFLGRLLEALGDKVGREELMARSIALIKELTGYRLLLLIVRESSRWRVTHLDVSQGNVMVDSTAYIEDLLNGEGDRTVFRAALAQGKDIYYEPDLQSRSENSYGVLPGILNPDEKLGSQAVFMMRAGETVVGALSLDFVITNALSPAHRQLLGHFASWLGKLILQDDSFKSLNERVKLLDDIHAVADILSRVWHSSYGELYSLRNLVDACVASDDVGADSELKSNLRQLQLGIEHLSKIPEQLGPRRRELLLESVETDSLWTAVKLQLEAKAAVVAAEVLIDGDPDRVWADREILTMALCQVLDNSLDACRKRPMRRVILRTRRVSDIEVELTVSDTGVGGTAADLVKMQQLGYTTKSNGIGYGLFWVRQHVAKMEGRFLLASEGVNAGMNVSIFIPRARN